MHAPDLVAMQHHDCSSERGRGTKVQWKNTVPGLQVALARPPTCPQFLFINLESITLVNTNGCPALLAFVLAPDHLRFTCYDLPTAFPSICHLFTSSTFVGLST
jgi:hypothetical protein